MTSNIENLARRVEEDAFFLAYPLRLYAKSEGLDDAKLAAILGCSPKSLALIRLCRTPAVESDQFQKDIDQISEKYRVQADVLAEAVRRGQAILHLSGASDRAVATLAAARDAESQANDATQQGGEP